MQRSGWWTTCWVRSATTSWSDQLSIRANRSPSPYRCLCLSSSVWYVFSFFVIIVLFGVTENAAKALSGNAPAVEKMPRNHNFLRAGAPSHKTGALFYLFSSPLRLKCPAPATAQLYMLPSFIFWSQSVNCNPVCFVLSPGTDNLDSYLLWLLAILVHSAF